ncbi:MAG TPA: histidine phosphatase family protein [Casimicrobiaceae bacterium]
MLFQPPLGERQSLALGRRFGRLPAGSQPDVVLCSPYLRARETATLLMDAAGMGRAVDLLLPDERLREKEFGILDRLTKTGIAQHYPDLHAQRAHVGKFYFRPPGGESWCDVIFRLRSVIDTILLEHRDRRLLVVTHQVVVNGFRYLLEKLDEAQIMAIDRAADVPNWAVTSYEFGARPAISGKWTPRLINFVAPLEETGTLVTVAKDLPVAPKA